MNIFVLVAGTNEPSNSNMLADTFIQGLQQHTDVDIHKRRLKDMQIEQFSIDFYDPQCSQEEDFCILQSFIEEADGFVIATPIWNFGVPGHLKNFIDRMGSFALDESRSRGTLKGKPFFLIFTGGAPAPAWKALMQKTTSFLPEGLKYFGAYYAGHYFEGKCTKGRGKFGLVVDERPKSLSSVRKKGYEFGKIVQNYIATGKPPVTEQVRSKVVQWGEALLKKIS